MDSNLLLTPKRSPREGEEEFPTSRKRAIKELGRAVSPLKMRWVPDVVAADSQPGEEEQQKEEREKEQSATLPADRTFFLNGRCWKFSQRGGWGTTTQDHYEIAFSTSPASAPAALVMKMVSGTSPAGNFGGFQECYWRIGNFVSGVSSGSASYQHIPDLDGGEGDNPLEKWHDTPAKELGKFLGGGDEHIRKALEKEELKYLPPGEFVKVAFAQHLRAQSEQEKEVNFWGDHFSLRSFLRLIKSIQDTHQAMLYAQKEQPSSGFPLPLPPVPEKDVIGSEEMDEDDDEGGPLDSEYFDPGVSAGSEWFLRKMQIDEFGDTLIERERMIELNRKYPIPLNLVLMYS